MLLIKDICNIHFTSFDSFPRETTINVFLDQISSNYV